MTDGMEERLREILRERAGQATVAGDPVDSVRGRMRRRARRRGIAVASTAAACVAGIAIAATAFAGNDTSSRPIGPAASSSNPGTTGTLPPNVSSRALPSAYTFSGLSTDSGSLLLTGVVASADPNSPCVRAPIDASTLTVSAVTTSSCDDPASSGDLVAVTVTNPDAGSNDFASAIAVTRVDPATGTLSTGPTLMRFNDASNTHVVTACGGGSLWIYDVDTDNGPEAIQVSATTGKVEDVVRTQQFYRPVLAANSDGLWLGNSIEGSPVAGAVFHVASGSHTVTTVVSNPNDAVDWLVADSGHVWAGIRPAGASLLSLWRFDGPTAKVALQVSEPSLEAGLNFVVGDEQDGLWLTTPGPPIGATPSLTDDQHLDVVRLDPNTGQPTVEAALPPLDQIAAESQTLEGQAAFLAGNYFLLQSPSVGGYTGFTQLLRVTPLP